MPRYLNNRKSLTKEVTTVMPTQWIRQVVYVVERWETNVLPAELHNWNHLLKAQRLSRGCVVHRRPSSTVVGRKRSIS